MVAKICSLISWLVLYGIVSSRPTFDIYTEKNSNIINIGMVKSFMLRENNCFSYAFFMPFLCSGLSRSGEAMEYMCVYDCNSIKISILS